jgi:Na+/H+ antiporter NhaD/arsenite permease-like protein
MTNTPPHPAPGTTPIILAIFLLTYLGIAAGRVPGLKLDRTGIALLGAIGIMLFCRLPTQTIVGFINWPTILLLFGFFVITAQLQLSGFFGRVATGISARLGHPARFLFQIMAVTAALSAFLNHDIVCAVFTPIVASALLRRGLNPVPFLIALAISSNIGAAATPVGNPQDMMIAQIAGLGFGPYVLWCFVPVLFALGVAYGIIWFLSRGQLALPPAAQVAAGAAEPDPFDRAHTIKGLVILALVIAFFFTPVPKELVALTAAGVHLASPKFRTEDLLRPVNWSILVLFIGLFIVTGAFQSTGYGAAAVHWLAGAGVHLHSAPTLALVTVILSNLINNSVAVMLLVNLVDVSHPAAAYILALANSFGGSLLIMGSVANIIVAQQARDFGISIGFREFARIGIPVTLAAMAGLLLWVELLR